jgi:dynein heavy chain
LPWPEEALVDVSSNFLGKYDKLDASQQDRNRLYQMMGAMQAVVGDICGTYYTRMRKHVYVTPKSYLCLIDFYKALYEVKYNEVNILEKQVNQGLAKLADASEDVNKMKVQLGKEKEVLAVEEKKTNELLSVVTAAKAKADKKKEEVQGQADECNATKDSILKEKAEANKELEAAMPFLYAAQEACNSVQKKDVDEVKKMGVVAPIIRYTFDGIQLVQSKALVTIGMGPRIINKMEQVWINDSFDECTKKDLASMSWLADLLFFADKEKDTLNDEIIELLEPYLRFNENPELHWGPWTHAVLEPELAGKVSSAARGLCKFVGALSGYYGASKIVKPKMEALTVAEAKNMELSPALEKVLATVDANTATLDTMLGACNGEEACEGKAIQTAIEAELASLDPSALNGCLQKKVAAMSEERLLTAEVEMANQQLENMRQDLADVLAGKQRQAKSPIKLDPADFPELTIANATVPGEFMTMPLCEQQLHKLQKQVLSLKEQKLKSLAKQTEIKLNALAKAEKGPAPVPQKDETKQDQPPKQSALGEEAVDLIDLAP